VLVEDSVLQDVDLTQLIARHNTISLGLLRKAGLA
jgi:hypothetical protein